MLDFNYHIHSTFSDGQSPMWQMTQQAHRLGLKHIAITDHGPVPFQNDWSIDQSVRKAYIKMINEQKELYPDMNIFRGLELDYIPGVTTDFQKLKELWELEVVTGSVHLVKHPESGKLWFIDGPQKNYDTGLDKIFNQDIEKAVQTYFHQINEMIRTQKPDIIGHIDKIRMNNMKRYFLPSDPWYQELLEETLTHVKSCNCILEINPRGFYKGKVEDLFPSDIALEIIRDNNIPVTINTDAHKTDELTKGHDIAIKKLKKKGVNSIKRLTEKGWEDYAL